MITPEKLEQLVDFQGKSLIITDSYSIKYFPVGMRTKFYAGSNGGLYYIDHYGDEANACEFIRNFSEGNITVEVEEGKVTVEAVEDKPVFKKGDKVKIVKASLPIFWYAKHIGEEFTLIREYKGDWVVIEEMCHTVGVEDIELVVEEPKKHNDSTKELLSVQEYLRQTGVQGLDVVISASQMLVVDEAGECYECEDISHVYAVVDAVALLGKARK